MKGVLDKTILLGAEQFESMRSLFTAPDRMKRMVAGLLEEFLEGQYERERIAYEEIARQFCFGSHGELEASGRFVTIDFTTRQLKLMKRNKVED